MRHVALAGTTGRIYVFGGRSENDLTSAVDAFDPGTNAWSTITSMPTVREWPAGAVAAGKMVVIGGLRGNNPLGVVEAYDPSSNTWQTLAPMPTPRWGAVAVALDDRIYVIGGRKSDDDVLNTVEMLDVRSNTWSSKTPLPRRLAFASGAAAVSSAIGGTVFVVGGQTPDLGGGMLSRLSNEDTLWIYNPAGNTWIQGKPEPTTRTGPSAVALAGKVYVFGGFVGSSLMRSAARHYDVYDVSSGSWSDTQTMPKPRAETAAVALDGRIFVVGGAGDAQRSVDELR
jgi:N-acetylneuraminic acid mutarotase